MHSEILCNKNNIKLIKKYYISDEEDFYELDFKCNYNKESNFFEIIDKNELESFICKINKDLITSINRTDENIIYRFKNIINNDKDDFILNIRISEYIRKKDSLSLVYVNNNNNGPVSSIDIEYFNYKIELKNDIIYFNSSFKFKEDLDEFVSNIVMLILKKCFHRLRKKIELK
jgi:hypothetical protein